MNQLFILLLLFLVTTSYGQALTSDTTPKVVQVNTNKALKPAYFVDGKFATGLLIDPQLIDSMNVVKGEVQIDNHKYQGQIFIRTKTAIGDRLISLTALKDKYTAFKNQPAIFLVNGKMVTENYDTYVVDESYLVQINVDTATENIPVGVIELLTKNNQNTEKPGEMRIRGGAVAVN